MTREIRALDERIEKDMAETKEIMKHGYRCIRTQCWLGKSGQCGKVNGRWRKECLWDIRDLELDVQRHIREAEVDRKMRMMKGKR